MKATVKLVADTEKVPIPLRADTGVPLVHLFLHLLAHLFSQVAFSASRSGDELISVAYQSGVAGHLGQGFRVLLGKCGHLPDGGVRAKWVR